MTLAACASGTTDDETGAGGTSAAGQAGASGAAGASGGATGLAGSGPGGATGIAGSPGQGGSTGVAGSGHGGATGVAGSGHGGATGVAGSPGQGGATGIAGSPGQGGSTGVAGSGRGGATGLAGMSGARGGATGTAGAGTAGNPGTGGAVDACSVNPSLSGGTTIQTSNRTGTAAGMSWALWSNGSGGSITTYDFPAFKATWNNSGDFLARLGLQWNATKTYDQFGTINAEFNSKKSGSGGGYSYIGIYGWSVSPCVEFYIVDDSYNKLPVNPGSTTNKGTATIDGGTYTLYTRNTTGTGGSKCSGVNSWLQFYSIRQTARTCGQISVTEHFNAWAKAGMTLGKMDQVQILVEVGGGSGSIEFPLASVTATNP